MSAEELRIQTSKTLEGLNPEQLALAQHIYGPVVGVAGPGSGKTHTVVSRVAYMIESGIHPDNIVMFSFTKKAAGEMKERVIKRIPSAQTMTVGTYHSFCARLLRKYANYLGFDSNFSIYDTEDSKKLLKQIANDPFYKPELILSKISGWKSRMITPTLAEQMAEDSFERKIASFYKEYQKQLKEQEAMDFDDLIGHTIDLLIDNPTVRQEVNERYQYIIADEFQDSSPKDIELIRLLAGEYKNICMIMDDCQCLLPGTMIKTTEGYSPVEGVTEDTDLIVASGHKSTAVSKPERVSSRHYSGKIVKVTTESGKVLQGTPNHMVFSRQVPIEGRQYVYLMFKKGLGYRIGRTSSVRQGSRKSIKNGYEVRLTQEKSDALWILKTCDSVEEAIYWESHYAYKYGIPQYVFHSRGTGLTNQSIQRLYNSIDTHERAMQLMKDEFIFESYPHFRPAGATRSYAKRLVLNFVMFGSKEIAKRTHNTAKLETINMHKHVTYSNTQDPEFADVISKHLTGGWYGKEEKYFSSTRVLVDYDHLHDETEAIAETLPEAEVHQKARLTEDNFDFTPLSHIREGMCVPIQKDGFIEEELVTKVEYSDYVGPVYDIDVKYYRNYIAEDIVVHNSIYSFRGADIDAVLALEEVFPDLETYLLRQNYRSTSTIVGASMSLISHNSNQIEKEIYTENEEGEKIVYMEALTQPEESAKVTKLVKSLIKTGEYSYKDIAILYRLSHLSRSIEDNFLANSIPYSIVGGLPFYARKEIKDIMSYIRLLHNGKDKQAFERVINVPKRGIGEKALNNILSVANEKKHATMNLIEVCKDVTLKGKAKKGLENFNEIMALLQDKSENGLTPGELIEEVINATDYRKYLLTEEDAEERLQNLVELKDIAEQYETLDDFIYNMSLNSVEEDNEETEDKVQLLTMHASKGLEFPVVIIIGANEGTTPHHKATTSKQVDEERRLFYVAISRAEKMLFITRPKNVNLKGQTIRTTASRFIDEIDDVYLMRL